MNSSTIRLVFLAGLFFALACGPEEQVQAPPPTVSYALPVIKDVPVYSEFVGEIKGLFDIPIRARVDGFLEKRLFKEGSEVKRGQLLYVIDSQPYRAEVANRKSELAEARTMLVRADNELKRIQPLAEMNAVSQSDLDAAIAEKGAAEASVEAAQAKLELAEINLGYTEIKSPIDGVIGKSIAKRGEYVGKYPNPVILTTVSRIDTILVQFFITESKYLQVAREFLVENNADRIRGGNSRKQSSIQLIFSDGSIHEQMGTFDFIDREVNKETGSMLVQASFPNPIYLARPGQFARLKILMRTVENAVLIPQRSVMDVQGSLNVYVVNDSNQIELREIIAKEKIGDLILVQEGLNKDDKVVLQGIQRIRGGSVVNAVRDTFESKSNAPL